jgi:signal transduction histidine kinase
MTEKVREVSLQVAHDIQSPVAALSMMASHLEHLPEEERSMMRSAVNRISDIVDSLQASSIQDDRREKTEDKSKLSVELLSSFIEDLVSEKRLQFKNRPNLKIETQLGEGASCAFSGINDREFQRLISNVMNNAVEATELSRADGHVRIVVSSQNKFSEILIQDNGKGVHKELLSQLGQRGASFEKEGGSGLGLYHARSTVESWG